MFTLNPAVHKCLHVSDYTNQLAKYGSFLLLIKRTEMTILLVVTEDDRINRINKHAPTEFISMPHQTFLKPL
ncbi:MAG: hypothetical protein ABIR06_03010 [Cyclobacteriaceae bacterium]